MGALLNYLTDTSVAPLQRDLVEVCMCVGVWMCVCMCVGMYVCACVWVCAMCAYCPLSNYVSL